MRSIIPPGYVDPYTASLAIAAYGKLVIEMQDTKKEVSISAKIDKLNREQKEKVAPSEPGRFSCYA
jgi:hypothetical protein